ncbi:hypothetical protein P7C70_g1069, partial [Phenoliferia sp. Uapishka_3]
MRFLLGVEVFLLVLFYVGFLNARPDLSSLALKTSPFPNHRSPARTSSHAPPPNAAEYDQAAKSVRPQNDTPVPSMLPYSMLHLDSMVSSRLPPGIRTTATCDSASRCAVTVSGLEEQVADASAEIPGALIYRFRLLFQDRIESRAEVSLLGASLLSSPVSILVFCSSISICVVTFLPNHPSTAPPPSLRAVFDHLVCCDMFEVRTMPLGAICCANTSPAEQKYAYQRVQLPSTPPPSSALDLSPFDRPRRFAASPSAWACLGALVVVPTLLYVSFGPVTPPLPNLTTPEPNPIPKLRLAQLNQDYDPAREGFGTGSANLRAYRDQLHRAYEGLFGGERGSAAVDVFQQSDATSGTVNEDKARRLDPLWTTTQCALEPSCPLSAAPVPSDLYMTAAEVDPEPPSIASWRQFNPTFKMNLFSDADVFNWIKSRFPDGTIYQDFTTLPINILQFDLFRLIVLFARGGVYTDADTYSMKAFEKWGAGATDLTDPNLLFDGKDDGVLSKPPALVIGIEWAGRTETNLLNPLFSRSVGVVQWTFGATKGHPVILDAIRRVVRHSRMAKGEEVDESGATGPLHFDPEGERMVLEWSGPAVLSDAVARYVRTRWGVSLESLGEFSHPVRIGDVLILPVGALNARKATFLKLLDWALGRNHTPLTDLEDCVIHMHAASWWGKKIHHDERI